MIEHIFISDLEKRLLLGAHQTLIESGFTNDILKNELNFNSIATDSIDDSTNTMVFDSLKDTVYHDEYPIICLKSSRIAQLQVNDVILNILYRDLDSFQAAKFLLDIKKYIENRIITLDLKNIKRHYFLLLELLHSPAIDFKSEFSEKLPSENVFVDIVQNIHSQVHGETVMINKLFGEVFLDKGYAESLEFVIAKKNHLAIKSTHKIEETGNEIKIKCNNIENSSLFSFYQKNLDIQYFKMKRSRNLVTIESDYKGIFRHIEIIVPVGDLAFRAETQVSSGKCEFDIKKGIILWRFRDTVFKKETLKFTISALGS